MGMETCANCGRTIGNLEAAHLFGDKVVCASCRGILAGIDPKPPASSRSERKSLMIILGGAGLFILGTRVIYELRKGGLSERYSTLAEIMGLVGLAGVLIAFYGLVSFAIHFMRRP